MGQYYKPCNLDKKEYLNSYDYANGLKLMEHSYVGNNFVNAVVMLLANEWKNDRIVWAGDYADEEAVIEDGEKETLNIYSKKFKQIKPSCDDFKYAYIINHSKKEYVIIDNGKEEDRNIHPLPLLTCEGNGRGGGDFNGNDISGLIGLWSRDSLEAIENKIDIPKEYKELIFNLKEDF